MGEADSLKEFITFLQIGARFDLKTVALGHVLGLTGTNSGLESLLECPEILVSLISLLNDSTVPVSRDASLCLVNISANEQGADTLIHLDVQSNCPPLQRPPEDIIRTTLNFIFDPDSQLADPCCMILSNLTRTRRLIEEIVDIIEASDKTFDEIINVFTRNNYNKKGAKLHYLGPVLSNLSQSGRVRKHILDKEKNVVQRLLPFTEYKESLVRRGGVVGTLKNCCFETDSHEWLLSEDVDILPRLLLPLAGGEEFDEEDNDKLPVELQYLPADKTREEDPDIRCILLEAINQLCTLRSSRDLIRNKNAYVILRELHKWEKDKKALLACENLVDILIRTEDEIGHENLKTIQVPEELNVQFDKMLELPDNNV